MIKNLPLAILASFSILGASAQPVITASNAIPTFGDQYDYYVDTYYYTTPTESASNNTWDFSNHGTFNFISVAYDNPNNGVYGSSFSGTNLLEISNGAEAYYEVNSSKMAYKGVYDPNSGMEVNYTNAQEIAVFPMTVGTTRSETFASVTSIPGYAVHRTGNMDFTGIGTGTMVFPGKTLDNVLMVKGEYEFSDQIMGQTTTEYAQTSYFFFNGVTRTFLASYVETYIMGTMTESRLTILEESLALNVNELNVPLTDQVNFYPNPVVNDVTFTNVNGQPTYVSIFDASGKEIKRVIVNQENQKVDLSELASGIYTMQCNLNNKLYTKQLIKK